MTNEEAIRSMTTQELAHEIVCGFPKCEEICEDGDYFCFTTCNYNHGEKLIEAWLKADQRDSYEQIWERVKKN